MSGASIGEKGPAGPREKFLAAALLALLAVTLVYWPCLHGEFTSWDDDVYVTRNPRIGDLSPSGLARLAGSFVSGNYHPLTMAVLSVSYRLFGLRPRAFHAANLMLHAVNTLLVLWLLSRFSGSTAAALAATLLWALHPQRVETVAWVADIKDALSAFFLLSATIAYVSWRQRGGAGRYLLAAAFFGCALLSKAGVVFWPLVLFAVDGAVQDGSPRPSPATKLPLAALSAAAAAAAVLARNSYELVLREKDHHLGERLLLGLYRLVGHYLPGMVWPGAGLPLNPFHVQGGRLLPPRPMIWLSLAGGAFLVLALFRLRRRPGLFLGGIWFAALLAPALTVVTVGHSADRFLYLPAVGMALILALVWKRQAAGGRGVPMVWAGIVVLAVLSFVSRNETAKWRDSVSLWSRAAGAYPAVADYGNNLGNAYLQRGEYQRAVVEYAKVLAMDARHVEALSNRAAAWTKLGELDRAAADLDAALRLRPDNAGALVNRGILRAETGKVEAALADLSLAAALAPSRPEAYFNRGNVRAAAGQHDLAVADYSRALKLFPADALAYRNRGASYEAMGELEPALADFTRAIAIDPALVSAFQYRARAYAKQGDFVRARADLRTIEALGGQPWPETTNMPREK